jgi:ribosomal protein L11 methylase PrmA
MGRWDLIDEKMDQLQVLTQRVVKVVICNIIEGILHEMWPSSTKPIGSRITITNYWIISSKLLKKKKHFVYQSYLNNSYMYMYVSL